MNPVNREKEMQIFTCMLSDPDPKDRYVGRFDVPVYLNGVKVYESNETCDYSDKKAFLCPGCFKAVTFGRDDKAHPYVKAQPTPAFDELERVSTSRGFRLHTRRCHPAFPQDGISRVVTDQQQYTVKKLAYLSKRDARWDSTLVQSSFFKEEVGTAFVYVRDRVPVSYVAFRREDIPDHGSTCVIWDLFTLPPYRNQGLATSVLNHGIKELTIDREYLPVSLPYRECSKNILQKASTKYVIDRWGFQYNRETWESVDSPVTPYS